LVVPEKMDYRDITAAAILMVEAVEVVEAVEP
jgi:hypothetical protein